MTLAKACSSSARLANWVIGASGSTRCGGRRVITGSVCTQWKPHKSGSSTSMWSWMSRLARSLRGKLGLIVLQISGRLGLGSSRVSRPGVIRVVGKLYFVRHSNSTAISQAEFAKFNSTMNGRPFNWYSNYGILAAINLYPKGIATTYW